MYRFDDRWYPRSDRQIAADKEREEFGRRVLEEAKSSTSPARLTDIHEANRQGHHGGSAYNITIALYNNSCLPIEVKADIVAVVHSHRANLPDGWKYMTEID